MKNRKQEDVNKNRHLINSDIRSFKVRVVDGLESDGIYDTSVAIDMAKNLDKDLVLINSKLSPPICRVVNYGKFLYSEKKKKKELSSKQNKTTLKELRLGPDIAENDFNVQKRKAEKFLIKGNKVKLTIFFKGRNISFKDKGKHVLLKMADELSEISVPEYMPKLEGRKMNITLKSKK